MPEGWREHGDGAQREFKRADWGSAWWHGRYDPWKLMLWPEQGASTMSSSQDGLHGEHRVHVMSWWRAMQVPRPRLRRRHLTSTEQYAWWKPRWPTASKLALSMRSATSSGAPSVAWLASTACKALSTGRSSGKPCLPRVGEGCEIAWASGRSQGQMIHVLAKPEEVRWKSSALGAHT